MLLVLKKATVPDTVMQRADFQSEVVSAHGVSCSSGFSPRPLPSCTRGRAACLLRAPVLLQRLPVLHQAARVRRGDPRSDTPQGGGRDCGSMEINTCKDSRAHSVGMAGVRWGSRGQVHPRLRLQQPVGGASCEHGKRVHGERDAR